MTEKSASDVLREKLTERGVEYDVKALRETEWTVNGVIWHANEYDGKLNVYVRNNDMLLTPEQAIAATMGSDDEYEAKMDELLCRLTNGKWSKSRAYDLDFMEQCINEEFETLYAKEQADAEVGNGTLTAEQVREAVMLADRWEKPMGNTGLTNTHLIIRDDGWQAIADELNAGRR